MRLSRPRRKQQIFGVSDLRDLNETRFLHLIRNRQPISRAELVKATELSPGTISVVVGRLIQAGLILEALDAPSSGGRPATYLQVNAERAYAIGMSVGVHQTECVLSDFNGRILTEFGVRTRADGEPFLRQVARDFKHQLTSQFPHAKIEAAAVSVPGMLDRDKGSLVTSPNLGWSQVPFRDVLEAEFGTTVYVENDANAAALSELWYGPPNLEPDLDLVFVLVVEGLGTGLIMNGHLYSGSPIGLGGFGHFPMDPGGPQCSCGNFGCWESLASDTATMRRFGDAYPEDVHLVHSVRDLALLAHQGHTGACATLIETGRALGRGIRGLAQGLASRTIVVGGQITAAWDLVGPAILEEVSSGYLIPGSSKPDIRPASAQRATLFGAIPIAFSGLLAGGKEQ